jgi:hypothetical protein
MIEHCGMRFAVSHKALWMIDIKNSFAAFCGHRAQLFGFTWRGNIIFGMIV